MTCLFVGNITSTVTENQLVTAFSAIGPCKVELKGKYAFIEYENPSDSKEAMKKLTDREKLILNLRFFNGRTQMEVADEIGISQAQVSRLEKNALKMIKNFIE